MKDLRLLEVDLHVSELRLWCLLRRVVRHDCYSHFVAMYTGRITRIPRHLGREVRFSLRFRLPPPPRSEPEMHVFHLSATIGDSSHQHAANTYTGATVVFWSLQHEQTIGQGSPQHRPRRTAFWYACQVYEGANKKPASHRRRALHLADAGSLKLKKVHALLYYEVSSALPFLSPLFSPN
jgi:hypothetical protein